jgi:outer membrane lipoprotein-sorting protein
MIKALNLNNLVKLCITISICLIFAQQATAEEQNSQNENDDKKIILTQQDVENIMDVQSYLAEIKTLQANFVQVNPNGGPIVNGELFIKKPGKMLIKYKKPFEIDYYIIGDSIIQYDKDIDQVGRAHAEGNPLKILLYDDVMFLNNNLLNVTHVEDVGGKLSIFMATDNEEIEEQISGLVLQFQRNPLSLIAIQRYDQQGNKIDMSFPSLDINTELNDEMFNFVRPKPKYPTVRQ